MVLPLPVKVGAPEDAVSFIDLSGYADFFADLQMGFPMPTRRALFGCSAPLRAIADAAPLKVRSVGSFEGSFVPTLLDFSRLDERFRILGCRMEAAAAVSRLRLCRLQTESR